MNGEAIIYLRLSDFRDEDDLTFTEREHELRALAARIGVPVLRVAIENDLNGNGRNRGASAYKTPLQVATSTGLITFRTDRPEFASAALDLQRGIAKVLIVGDDSRIARNERDGLDLLDACRVSGASVVSLDDEGDPRWILTGGGTRDEVTRFKDRIADARRFSDDIAAKVRKGRKRWAGKSYGGGRPGYGFEVAPDTEEHRRNLVIVEPEARELRWAAGLIVNGASLKWCAQDLRERGVPTRTGAKWSAGSLRDALLKPSVAGLIGNGRGELIPAPWPHIIEPEQWHALRGLLTDPARRTNAGRSNAPKWLVSVYATCGVCGGKLRVGGAGHGRGPAYVGAECGHIRRDAAKVDEYVAATVVGVMKRPAILEQLRPPARDGVDVAGLKREAGELAERRDRFRAMAAAGTIEPDDLSGILAGIRRRQAAISEELAASSTAPDIAAEFRVKPAEVAWAAMPTPARRALVAKLYDVVITPAGRGRGFDPATVVLTPKLTDHADHS